MKKPEDLRMPWRKFFVMAGLLVLAACGSKSSGGGKYDWEIKPDSEANIRTLEAFANALPGEVIHFDEGQFLLKTTLMLDESQTGVIIEGAGQDKTILEFEEQTNGNGHNGILTTNSDLIIRDLTIRNTVGDGIKTQGENVIIRDTRVEWPGPPKTENGPYAIYPVLCTNVLVEDNFVHGASDSGIYMGQSDHVVVRRNHAEYNVTGIEIENCKNSDVYDNTVTHNTGGILVFDLPGLPVQGGNSTRVFNNQVIENNTDNFAPEGNIVAIVPPGTGVFTFANDKVEVFGNTVQNNKSFQFLVGSLSTLKIIDPNMYTPDPNYDPDPEGVYIHDNTVIGGGDAPSGMISDVILSQLTGVTTLPTLTWDGNIDESKLVNGVVPSEKRVCFKNNTGENLNGVNLDVVGVLGTGVVWGLDQFDCTQPPLPPISWPGLTD